MKKFPKTLQNKWSRFNQFEKVFIVYTIFLFFIETFLPVANILDVQITFISSHIPVLSFINILSLILLVLWNISFRFKQFIHNISSFQHDTLLNFWILWTHSLVLLAYNGILQIEAIKLSSERIQLLSWYYILWAVLVFWLIWNLVLSINFTNTSKKHKYTNVVFKSNEKTIAEQTDIKGLFD